MAKKSYRKQGEDSWEIRLSLGKDPETGKYIPFRETFYGSESECQQYINDKKYEFRHGKKPKQSNLAFGQFIDVYTEKFVNEQLKPSTKRLYKMTIARYIKPHRIIKIKLHDMTALHIDQLYADLRKKVSLNIVKDVHTVMCSALRQAYIWDYITEKFKIDKVEPIPAKDRQVMKKKAKQKRHVWVPQDVYDFLQWIRNRGQRRYFIYLIAATIGLRRGENLALRWDESIDFENKKINIAGSITENKYEEYTKEDGSYRSIHMFPTLFSELQQYKNIQDQELKFKEEKYIKEGWVHSDAFGKLLMRPDGISHKFKEDINSFNDERAKNNKTPLPMITLHDLRHTCASLMYNYFGVPIELISEILGHKSGVDFTRGTYVDDDVNVQKPAFEGFDQLLSLEAGWVETTRGRHMCSECVMAEVRTTDENKKNIFCLKYNNWSKAIARSCEGAIKKV